MKRDTPFTDHHSRFLAGRFGMKVFLLSLMMLFAATLVGFAVIRIQLEQRSVWPQDLPPLPHLVWVSTLVLVASSASVQWAVTGVRRGSDKQLRTGLLLTLALGVLFLIVQSVCWLTWLETVSLRWSESEEYRFALTSFYVLTGLHALHVIGGLIPMFVVTRRAIRGWYWPDYRSGVEFTATYWHFLGGVWIVLLVTMLVGM